MSEQLRKALQTLDRHLKGAAAALAEANRAAESLRASATQPSPDNPDRRPAV